MSITKITTPELLDFPNDSTSSANTSGTVIPTGITDATSVEYLVVAGGGGTTNYNGGGGGAGGLLNDSIVMNDSIIYSITIGEGGAAGNNTDPLTSTNDGDDSTLNGSDITLITATGGGRGGLRGTNSNNAGGDGGSGGGGGSIGSGGNVAGSGNTPSTTPSQGNDGGVGADFGDYRGGGGGGAGAAGGSSGSGGNGGVGLDMSSVINSTNATSASVGEVSGSGVYFAGGGGAGANSNPGSGGLGGGGNGGTSSPAGQGTEGTGGGGGGGSYPSALNAAKGGRGVVILRYSASRTATTSGFTAEAGPYTEGDYKVLVLKQGTGTVVFSGSPTNGRPTTSLNAGEFRFNTTTGYVEYYNGSTWFQIADEYITGQPTTCICNYPSNTAFTALYTMDGNADDSCGSLNLTNIYNVPFVTSSPWGGSYQSADFDPSASPEEYLTIASGLGSVADRTRSLWIYLDTIPSVFATVLYIGPTGSPNQNYEVLSVSSSTTGHVRLQSRYGTGTNADIESLSALSTSTWYHVAWVYEGTSIYLYVNGALQGSTTNTVTDTSSYPAFFGAWHTGDTEFDGKIAQARFYNQALNGNQITELYNEVACN